MLCMYTSYSGDLNKFNDTLVVNSTVFSVYTMPVTEDFQAASFPPTAWSIQSVGGSYTWQQATGIPGATGTTTTCAFINNYSYNNPAAEDKLVTYTVSLAGATSARMTFDVSYARYSTAYSDSLRVDVSADCGEIWLPTGYFKGGIISGNGRNANRILYACFCCTVEKRYSRPYHMGRLECYYKICKHQPIRE